MKFRRCKVRGCDPHGWWDGCERHAWIPIDRAIVGAVVAIEFPGDEPRDYHIVECDTLVAGMRERLACEERPVP